MKLRQDSHKFQVSLCYIVRLKNKDPLRHYKQNYLTPIIPGLRT